MREQPLVNAKKKKTYIETVTVITVNSTTKAWNHLLMLKTKHIIKTCKELLVFFAPRWFSGC